MESIKLIILSAKGNIEQAKQVLEKEGDKLESLEYDLFSTILNN